MNLHDPDGIRHVLCFCYRTMVASVPLLEFAIPRCDGELRAYYERHAAEERGHNEMLRADLYALGITDVPIFHQAAQLAGSQYYLVAHDHPALLLGYMLSLEKDSLTPAQVDVLSEHHGVDLTALRHHSKHDPGHKDDLLRVIDTLHPALRERVMWNERHVSAFIEKALL